LNVGVVRSKDKRNKFFHKTLMEKSDGKKNVLEIFPEVEAVIKVWQ
jgi:hypothetical protein